MRWNIPLGNVRVKLELMIATTSHEVGLAVTGVLRAPPEMVLDGADPRCQGLGVTPPRRLPQVLGEIFGGVPHVNGELRSWE